AWRWSFGVAASALVIASSLAYLSTLPITGMEMLLLRSRIPWLIADVIGQIVRGSGPRLAIVIAIMLPAICIIWIAAASLGRAATLKALLRREASVSLAPQFGLSFLRASVTVAALIGYLGALIVAGRAAGAGDEVRAGIFLVVFVALATAVAAVRSRLNWFLCLGAISAARDGHDTFSAVVAALGLFRRHAGKFAGAGAVFGTIHAVLFAFFTVISLLVLALAAQGPPGVSLFFLAAITLAYFSLVDAVYIARLAAYVAIDESDRMPPLAPVAVEPEPVAPEPEPPVPVPEPLVGIS
ncbi:MAG: hypothetical protein WA463_15615, partial [Terriglobales bacterium]